MRLIRNFSFLLMVGLTGILLSTDARADPITSGPICNYPYPGMVSFAAAGTCEDDKVDDAGEACTICFEDPPTDLDFTFCNTGQQHYAADVYCLYDDNR